MLAQRYPDTFDGIVALAPAINWGQFIPAEYWPQQVMNRLGAYPQHASSTPLSQQQLKHVMRRMVQWMV